MVVGLILYMNVEIQWSGVLFGDTLLYEQARRRGMRWCENIGNCMLFEN